MRAKILFPYIFTIMNMKKQPFGFDLLGDEDPGDIRAALA